jgi:hypothetical protein
MSRTPSSQPAALKSGGREVIEYGEGDQEDKADRKTPADQLFLDRQEWLAAVAA